MAHRNDIKINMHAHLWTRIRGHVKFLRKNGAQNIQNENEISTVVYC